MQAVISHHVNGPVEIIFRTEDKFNLISAADLVPRPEQGNIFLIKTVSHARVRTFDIHDNHGLWMNISNGYRPIGFYQNQVTVVNDPLYQPMNIFLQKWFSTGDFRQYTGIPVQRLQDFSDGKFSAGFRPGIGGITIAAAKITAGKPDKGAGHARPG